MGVTVKRTVAVTVGALGMVLVAMSVAWACTANRHMDVSQQLVMPGATVNVSNANWVANGGTAFTTTQVEVRWAAKDVDRHVQPHNIRDLTQQLATAPVAANGTFSANATVPAGLAPGDYVIYAVGEHRYPHADIASVGMIIPGAPSSQPGAVSTQAPATEPPAAEPPAAEPPAAETPATETPAPGAPAPAAAPTAGAPAPAAAPAPAPAAVTPPRELVDASVASQPEARVPAALTNGIVSTSFSDEPVQASSPAAVPDATPSDSAATQGEFASPERSGYEWAGASETSGAPSALRAGLALLSSGMVLMLAGFTIATLSRRREKAKVTAT